MFPRLSRLGARLFLLAACCSHPSLTGAATPALLPVSSAADAAELHPFLPADGLAMGAAVIIVPDATFTDAFQDSASARMARWLTEHGIAGFVLRPRAAPGSVAAANEVSQAVQALRAKATTYQLSPRRIAVVGFGRGAEIAAQAAYALPADTSGGPASPSGRPDLLALIWGAHVPAEIATDAPATFIVGSTRNSDGMTATIDLWTKLRSARVSVDAHFFPQAEARAEFDAKDAQSGAWPEMFYAWARFQGFLTDEIRVPLKGMVYLDGRILPHGYVILTPVDFTGTGPVVARVFNSTATAPLGEFIVPAGQGPVPGRYKVDVRQNMNRWLSNSFSGGLVSARGGPATPEQIHFGHHRVLAPSIEDQRSFTKVRPSDRQDYVIEIKPGAEANQAMKIEVFSQ